MAFVYHGFCAIIIPIPKDSKANISDSDKYRRIAISTLLGKILDHIIIEIRPIIDHIIIYNNRKLNKDELNPPYCLFVTLMNCLGCHVGGSYAGAFGYADNIVLVAPSLQSLRKMIGICEQYAKTHSISFNPNRVSKHNIVILYG